MIRLPGCVKNTNHASIIILAAMNEHITATEMRQTDMLSASNWRNNWDLLV